MDLFFTLTGMKFVARAYSFFKSKAAKAFAAREKISFGTSGWRGIIDEDFTVDRVKQVTQAIADYIIEGPAKGDSIRQGLQKKRR
jgi:phosphoglucomutase